MAELLTLGAFAVRLDIFISVIMLFASLKNFYGCIPEELLWHLYGDLLKVLVIVFGVSVYDVPFISSDDSLGIIRIIVTT